LQKQEKLMRQVVTAVLLSFFVVFGATAENLRSMPPQKAGFSNERLERLNEIAKQYISSGKLPNVITMVNRGGRMVHFNVAGQHGTEDATPIKADDLYRIYSMTKPISSVAAMQLYEQGGFRLTDPVSKFVPELAELKYRDENGELVDAAPITMHQLLTHTAGFSYGFDPNDEIDQQYQQANLWSSKDLTEFAERLATLPLKYKPGSQWHYSVAVDITGLVVERISGERFDQYLKNHIFEPLGMKDTFFEVPSDQLHRLVDNHVFDHKTMKPQAFGKETFKQGVLGIQEADGAMINFEKVRLYSGGGGLVSTAMDYMKFGEMLRAGGRLGKARILSPKTIKFMTKNHLPATISASGTGEDPTSRRPHSFGFGLGFSVNMDPVASESLSSKGAYGWGGAAGTIFWVDPEEDLVVVGFMQMMLSPWAFREEIKTATYQALTESYE
jgi:CubicO group peptidase (beta-lactamase class C family)